MNLTEILIKHQSDKGPMPPEGHNYGPFYEKYFEPIRNEPLRILEIGIGGENVPNSGGNSLRAWKEYFPNAKIFGIDIHDKSHVNEDRIYTYKGSQIDQKFLMDLELRGPFDIIIDDGSHMSSHQIKSFQLLFEYALKPGGFYFVEDLSCSYRWDFEGCKKYSDIHSQDNAVNYFLDFVIDLMRPEIGLNEYRPSEYRKFIEHIDFGSEIMLIKKKI